MRIDFKGLSSDPDLKDLDSKRIESGQISNQDLARPVAGWTSEMIERKSVKQNLELLLKNHHWNIFTVDKTSAFIDFAHNVQKN